MLYKANPLTVVVLLLVVFVAHLSANSVLVLEHSQNEVCEGLISDLCESQVDCEGCEVCSAQCSCFNNCIHSACTSIADSISFINYPVISQKLLSRTVRQDRPPIYL